MAIEHPQVVIKCDFCPAQYKSDRAVLKPEWQHVTMAGVSGLVACPRHEVEQSVIDLSPADASERHYNKAAALATRDGKPPATD